MAIKSSDQITIVDLTDAYSVMLSSDAIALQATATNKLNAVKTVVVNVLALRGSEAITPSVTAADIVCPTNVTASVGSASGNVVPITFTFAAALAASGSITIPVVVDDITITKTLPFSISFVGATGAKGDAGEDAITLVITSSGGTIFKNTAIATTLTAHVYQAGVELNETQIAALGTIKWYKDGGTTAVSTGSTKSISAGDVSDKAVFEARLEA